MLSYYVLDVVPYCMYLVLYRNLCYISVSVELCYSNIINVNSLCSAKV